MAEALDKYIFTKQLNELDHKIQWEMSSLKMVGNSNSLTILLKWLPSCSLFFFLIWTKNKTMSNFFDSAKKKKEIIFVFIIENKSLLVLYKKKKKKEILLNKIFNLI